MPLNKSKTLFLLCVFNLSGCTTFRDIPVGLSRAPQVSGKNFSASIGTATTNTRTLYIAKDSERGDANTNSRINRSSEVFYYERALSSHVYNFVVTIEFLERSAMFFDNGLSGFQYQFFGPTRAESSSGEFSASAAIAYGQVTKRASNLVMAKSDSTADGRQFSHIGHFTVIGGYNLTDGFGLGLSLGTQPVISKFDGKIDDDENSRTIEQTSYDYLLGALIYFYGESIDTAIVHQWNYASDPISNNLYTNQYLSLRLSYTF